MYTDFYERISRPWRQLEGGPELLERLDAALRIAVAVSYVITLGWLAMQADYTRLIRAVVVPAVAFGIVTLLRRALNAPRPYESNPITPLIHKDTQGLSMPSRHMTSAVIIATTLLWVNVPLGIMGLLLCVAIAYVRIVGGVHFPRDIVAGAVLALVVALVGYVIIP